MVAGQFDLSSGAKRGGNALLALVGMYVGQMLLVMCIVSPISPYEHLPEVLVFGACATGATFVAVLNRRRRWLPLGIVCSLFFLLGSVVRHALGFTGGAYRMHSWLFATETLQTAWAVATLILLVKAKIAGRAAT